MKSNLFQVILFSIIVVYSSGINAQNPAPVKKSASVKTIRDIPHHTLWEKWMWIHRSVVFGVMKERPVNYDTAYIKTFYKRLVVTIPVITRFLEFNLIDSRSGNKLNFAPNLQCDLGVSISSRWATFIVNTGVSVFNKDVEARGKTIYRDFQLNLYSRKVTTDMFVQYYNGFYIRNSKSFDSYVSDAPFAVRPDVYALNMGVSTYYIVNHKRFSYRNSFAFVEQQKKSAGSILFGSYYSYLSVSGTPSLITSTFKADFDSLSHIRNGQTQNFGLNIGYIYTLVFLKKFYATGSLVQGLGAQQLVYERDDNSTYKQMHLNAGKLHARLGFGYDQGRYFAGAMAMADNFLQLGNPNANFNYTFGKLMVYVGYRLAVVKHERKLLRTLKLIDY